MTDVEIRLMRTNFPFPWTERVFQHPRQGGIVQILAANGVEVPLFTITRFLVHITNRYAQQAAAASSPGRGANPSTGAPS